MNIWFTLKSGEMVYSMVYLILSILGLTVSPFVYTLHMLDIVTRFTVMKIVVTSVTKHFAQLVLATLLGMLVIHIWTAVAFIFLVSNPQGQIAQLYNYGTGNVDCGTYAACLLSNVAFGFQSPPTFDIGDFASDPDSLVFRGIVVFLYNFFIVVVMVAIITGIIINTFGELRDERQKIETAINTKCYICGIDAAEFERHGNGFKHHKVYEHSIWDYCYCRIYLESKEESEYTGVETYIDDKIKDNTAASFFPLDRAISINRNPESDDEGDNDKIIAQLEDLRESQTKTDEQLKDIADAVIELKKFISEQNEQIKNNYDSLYTAVSGDADAPQVLSRQKSRVSTLNLPK